MLSDKIRSYKVDSIEKDLVLEFGDLSDGAIEFVANAANGRFETGYFYGDTKPKNIIVASSQIGCPSRCNFCELGDKPYVRNLNENEMTDQIALMLQIAARHGHDIDSANHKINWAKSGDALFNDQFVSALEDLAHFGFTHKLSRVFPAGSSVNERFRKIADFASEYGEPFQVQVSLISTSEEYRSKAAGVKVSPFDEIRKAADYWVNKNPNGRKINLSLIIDDGNPIDVKKVAEKFPKDLFRFRFRNYVPTDNGKRHGLVESTQEKFEEVYGAFQDRGYEVGTWATPTPTEMKFGLASNVTLHKYLKFIED